MRAKFSLLDIARIGAMFTPGDALEDVMPQHRRAYTDGDEIDYVEDNFNALKKALLLTERIDPTRDVVASLWVKRPNDAERGEVMVAGKSLPRQGEHIVPLWPDIVRAFAGMPTRTAEADGETCYYPIRNSDEDIVGVLMLTDDRRDRYFI